MEIIFKIRKIVLAISGVIIFLCPPVFAEITEQGTGMLFGADHAFFVTAAPGWVLDNQSAAHQELFMLFYLSGSTWTDSPVIVYGRATAKRETATIDGQVQKTVAEFIQKGSPDYRGAKRAPQITPGGQVAQIYHFTEDQWGNYEAAAYFDETRTINFLVFNARSKAFFNQYIEDFRRSSL